MGIALLAFSGLLQGLAKLNRAAPVAVKPQRGVACARPVWATRKPLPGPLACQVHAQAHPATSGVSPALRVLRVAESGTRVVGAGRMVISGRMADVCAELDRLAALEAAQARI